jgi:regulator of protease activity HflC (stomatin/prohibitin superfamily)
MNTLELVILLIVLVALAVVVVRFSFRTTPQAKAEIVERFGKHHRTLKAGPHIVIPGVDRVRALVDLREQVVSFRTEQVRTSDIVNLTLETDIYFRVIEAEKAIYEVTSYKFALQERTNTALRNVAAGMDMEEALNSRDQFNSELKKELDEATGAWGLRVIRAELKALEPPSAIREAIEREKSAEHDKKADELHAEGQSQKIVTTAMAEAMAVAWRAQGLAEGINRVFQTIAKGDEKQRLLIYEYLQTHVNRPPVASPWVDPVPPDGQGFGVPPTDGSEPD